MTLKLAGSIADLAAGVVVVGTLADWLPPVAAGFAIVYTAIRIGEWARVAIWKHPPR